MGRAKKKRIRAMIVKKMAREKAARRHFVADRLRSIDRAAYVVAKILAGEF